jgi:hypothetical protein
MEVAVRIELIMIDDENLFFLSNFFEERDDCGVIEFLLKVL